MPDDSEEEEEGGEGEGEEGEEDGGREREDEDEIVGMYEEGSDKSEGEYDEGMRDHLLDLIALEAGLQTSSGSAGARGNNGSGACSDDAPGDDGCQLLRSFLTLAKGEKAPAALGCLSAPSPPYTIKPDSVLNDENHRNDSGKISNQETPGLFSGLLTVAPVAGDKSSGQRADKLVRLSDAIDSVAEHVGGNPGSASMLLKAIERRMKALRGAIERLRCNLRDPLGDSHFLNSQAHATDERARGRGRGEAPVQSLMPAGVIGGTEKERGSKRTRRDWVHGNGGTIGVLIGNGPSASETLVGGRLERRQGTAVHPSKPARERVVWHDVSGGREETPIPCIVCVPAGSATCTCLFCTMKGSDIIKCDNGGSRGARRAAGCLYGEAWWREFDYVAQRVMDDELQKSLKVR